ncbi:RNA-binding protein, putative [Plasmodium gallinaceum]|uniref:RNA-binding protein, putative n=1 Tax=Plasmodium gallinaceum TaxID=5849 RepID=A0A1J1GQS1_PLAGA|nr:RNA-binding protein, putative [Plasmodium gallinaceum]CRG93631.1 RNA-binding protein, putative [Plasmodium gallinaceum]
MIRQKRSYARIDNEDNSSSNSDDDNLIKRQRKSNSSNRSYVSIDDNRKKSSYSTAEMRIPYCLLLPNRAIGFVIGKSGNNVREIEKACGAIIKCQKEFDVSVYPPPSEKILTIFGKKENKKKALELVLEKSKNVMDFQEEDGKESIVIIVPTRSIPIIIGQKGSKISSLCERSSCEINVHKDDVPGIKDKAIFIKSKKINKIIDCIGIIYDLLEDIVENGILCLSEFPGVSKNNNNNNNNNNILTTTPSSNNNNNNNNIRNINNNISSSINSSNNSSKYSSMKKNENSNEETFNYDIDNCSVPKEKNLLLHKYGKEISSCVIRFVLDVETTAWIIGKSGCHIKEIRTITGAGAVIVDAPDNIENVKSCDRILTLSGSAESKFNALKLIVRQMEEREKNINNPMRMLVPGKAASFLIGRKGSIIKYITEQSGSQIQVAKNKDSENEKLVLISGSPESKILASILVLQKLEEYENPAIAREGLLIPLNDIYFNSNTKYSNTKKNNITSNNNKMYNKNSINNNDRFYSSNSLLNNNHNNYSNNSNDNNSISYHYDNLPNKNNNNNNNSNSLKNADMKDKIEQMFLQQIYKSFPVSSLPKILSVKQPYTIELNMPDVYLETFDSQNKNGKSLIEEIIEKSGCNISICTDSNDSSSYTFNLSITGSPLSNSLAILMIQAKIFQFDWF